MIYIACNFSLYIKGIWILIVCLAIVLIPTSTLFAQIEKTGTDSTYTEKKQTESSLMNLLEQVTLSDQKQNNSHDLDISEVIISSMISKHGNDFLDYFSSSFSWPKTNGSFIILISERPFRINTTQILIQVNDLEVFQNVLQPRTSYLEELAQYAQAITKQYILNYQQIMMELESSDRSGSGIY